MKIPLMAAWVIGMAAVVSGTGALSQASQQDNGQDQQILKEVRQILTSEHAFDGMSISPSVRKGVVTLDGTVGSQAAKVLATKEIQNVDGIKSVMNNLNVVGGTTKPILPTSSGDVQNKNVILPFGSILPVHVLAEINSKTAHVNDVFHATVATNVIANGYILVPAGTPIEGTVVEAKPAGHLVGPGLLTIALRRMTLNAPEGPRVVSFTVQPLSSKARGAASGESLGTAVNALMRSNEITVRPEQLLQFRMIQPAFVPIILKNGHQVPPVPVESTAATDPKTPQTQ
jgi:BON domain